MGWEVYSPTSLEEFQDRMGQLFENRAHVKNVKVDTAMRQIRVDLDWAANLKVPDFCIVLKSNRVVEARDVTTRMWNAMQGSIAPTRAETELLYNMIDQSAR